MESMIKECDEEASFPEAFVKKHIKYVIHPVPSV